MQKKPKLTSIEFTGPGGYVAAIKAAQLGLKVLFGSRNMGKH
jgi:hypothetical protein